jgi:hypothetical protein
MDGQNYRADDTQGYYAAVLSAQGAEFRGIQPGPRGTLILFTDANSKSTLALPASEFSPETVSRRLQENRSAFELEGRIQKSLC